MTFIYPDTNNFLHFRSFIEIDWTTLIGGGEYTLVISPTVVDELDKHKTNSNRKVAVKAKNAIEKLEKIETGEIQFNLIFITSRPSDAVYDQHKLSRSHADDGLFASLIEHEVGIADKKVLVTNDLGVKVRSKSLGIHSIKLPEEYKLAEELNEEEKKIKALEQELNELKNRLPKVSLVFNNSTNRLNHSLGKMQFAWPEYLERESRKNKRQYAKWDKQGNRLGNTAFTLGNMFNQISEEDIARYNKELDKYYAEYEEYLEQEYFYQSYLLRCVEVNLNLANDGTLPAEDTDVYLHFPDGFVLAEELDDEPKKPRPPRHPRSIFDSPSPPNLGFLGRNIESVFTKHDPNAPYLSRLEKTNSYEVEFKVPTVKHNMKMPLKKLYACFESMEAMKSFKVEYSLNVANLPKETNGDLHVIIGEGI